MRGSGRNCHVVNTGSGAKSAISRREGRIDEAFTAYLSDYQSAEQTGGWVTADKAAEICRSFNHNHP